MSSKSRYFSPYPTINSGYLSGGTGRHANNNYTFHDIVRPTNNAIGTNVIVQPNIDFNVFQENFSGNEILKPIETSNFNVIRLSVDTNFLFNDNRQLFVDLLQGNSKDNMAVTYTSPINAQDTFFRAFPVKNNFCNLKFRNTTGANIHIDYDISLSKFAQFTPPSQIGDSVEYSEMTNLTRSANDFYDDVSRDLFESSSIINRFGFFKDNISSSQIVSPVYIPENTTNSFIEVFGVSDSASDAYEIGVSGPIGESSVEGRVKNGIQLFGTSNGTISLNSYKYIDTVTFPQNNTGNISIYKNGTADLVAYIPAGFRNISSPIYYISKLEEGVLKEVRVRGQVIAQNGSIEVILNENDSLTTIWATSVIDGEVENVWNPDIQIPSNSTVYAVVRNVDTTPNEEQRVDVSMKILRYRLQPPNSVI